MTVKTQGGKVILKYGKVSCSCCEPECCLYAADQFGVDYTADDLPDAVDLVDPVGIEFINATRSGTTYEALDGNGNPMALEHTDSGWRLAYINYPDLGDPTPYENTVDCLIGDYDDGQYLVQDQFSDQLLVEFEGEAESVTRRELCAWDAEDGVCDLIRVFYNSDTCEWQVELQNCETDPGFNLAVKDGNQNTPVGSYNNGVTVSAL